MQKRVVRKNRSFSEYVFDFLQELKKPQYMSVFRQPVDTTIVTNYLLFVKQPMDLSTVTTKLLEGKYKNINDLKSDLELIIKNCEIFNPEGSWIRVNSDKYKTNLEKSWIKLLDTLTKKNFSDQERLDNIEEIPEALKLQQECSMENNKEIENISHRTRNQINGPNNSLNVSFHTQKVEEEDNLNANKFKISLKKSNQEDRFIIQNLKNYENENLKNTISFEDQLNDKTTKESQAKLEEEPIISQINELMDEIKKVNKESNAQTQQTPVLNLFSEKKADEVVKKVEKIPELKNEEMNIKFSISRSEANLAFINMLNHKIRKYKNLVSKIIGKLSKLFEKKVFPSSPMINSLISIIEDEEMKQNITFTKLNILILKMLLWFKYFYKKEDYFPDSKKKKGIYTSISFLFKLYFRIHKCTQKIKEIQPESVTSSSNPPMLDSNYLKEEISNFRILVEDEEKKLKKNEIKYMQPPAKSTDASQPNLIRNNSTKIVLNKAKNGKKFLVENKEKEEEKLNSWVLTLNKKIIDKNEKNMEKLANKKIVEEEKEIESNLVNKISEEGDFLDNLEFDATRKIVMELKRPPTTTIENNATRKKLHTTVDEFNISDEDEVNYYQDFLNPTIGNSANDYKNREIGMEENLSKEINTDSYKKSIYSSKIKLGENINNITCVIEDIFFVSLFEDIDMDNKKKYQNLIETYKSLNQPIKKPKIKDRLVTLEKSKLVTDISKEINLENLIKLELKVYCKKNDNPFNQEEKFFYFQNILDIRTFETFTNLKKNFFLLELSLKEYGHWILDSETIQKKSLKKALLTELMDLMKTNKLKLDQNIGIYYEIIELERNQQTNQIVFKIIIWSPINKLKDFSIIIDKISVLK